MPKNIQSLRLAIMHHGYHLVAVIVFSLAVNLLLLVPPLYMLQMYDRVLASRSSETLLMLTLLAFGMLAAMAMLEKVRGAVLVRIGLIIEERLGDRVFSAAFRCAQARGDGRAPQSLRDLEQVRTFVSGAGFIALCDAPWVPIFLCVVFLFHPLLGLVALGGAVLIFLLAVLNELATRRPLAEAGQISMEADGFFANSIRNSEAALAMNMLPGLRRHWRHRHDAALARQAVASDRAGVILALSKFSRLMVQIAMLGCGAYLAIEQIISPGTLVAASIVMGRGLAPIEQAVAHWRSFVVARGAYGRLRRLLEARPDAADPLSLPSPQGVLSVEMAVVVPAGGKVPVLRGVTLQLEPGECLGVVGPSAAGKTSLARLLAGVWPPAQGSVRLDGADLRHWHPDQLGAAIGYLPQTVELFDGTVAQNIARFAAEPVDAERVVAAARKAGAHEMILQLPQAYHTPIGADGVSLSGGQRQRVGLARALYGDPVLVILDEPNANLDTDGDRALLAALRHLRDDRAAVVVIAHRSELLAVTDRILVLRDGVPDLYGEREAVLAKLRRPRVVVPAKTGVSTPKNMPTAPTPVAPSVTWAPAAAGANGR